MFKLRVLEVCKLSTMDLFLLKVLDQNSAFFKVYFPYPNSNWGTYNISIWKLWNSLKQNVKFLACPSILCRRVTCMTVIQNCWSWCRSALFWETSGSRSALIRVIVGYGFASEYKSRSCLLEAQYGAVESRHKFASLWWAGSGTAFKWKVWSGSALKWWEGSGSELKWLWNCYFFV